MPDNNIAAVVQAYAEMTKHLVELNMALVRLQNGQGQATTEMTKISDTLEKIEKANQEQSENLRTHIESCFAESEASDASKNDDVKKHLSLLFYKGTGIIGLIIVAVVTIINFLMNSKIEEAVKIAIETIK